MSFFLNYLIRINPKKMTITRITTMSMIMVQTLVNTLARMPKMWKDIVTM